MTVYAFTELHNDYPAFVNLSEQPDGTLKFSVRTRGNGGNDYASITLADTQAEELAEAIFKHVYAADAPPDTPVAPDPTVSYARIPNHLDVADPSTTVYLPVDGGPATLREPVAAPLPAAPAPTEQAELPIARLMRWAAPKHMPVPHGGVCARTFVEFPKGAGDDGYWKEGEPLFTRAALAARQAPTEQEIIIGAFAIKVEKLLCAALGRKWSASGISIESLIGKLAARQAPTDSLAQGAGSIDSVGEELKVAPFHLSPHMAYAIARHVNARLARTAAPSEPVHYCPGCGFIGEGAGS
jgi:hypothetical protein